MNFTSALDKIKSTYSEDQVNYTPTERYLAELWIEELEEKQAIIMTFSSLFSKLIKCLTYDVPREDVLVILKGVEDQLNSYCFAGDVSWEVPDPDEKDGN